MQWCESARVQGCEGDGSAGVGDGGDVVAVSAWHEYVYVGSTRGSCIVSSSADVLGMNVVHGMIAVGEVCEMYGLYQLCGNKGSVGRASVFGLRWCGQGSERVVLCLCESGLFV